MSAKIAKACSRCAGAGKMKDGVTRAKKCRPCGGLGMVEVTKTLRWCRDADDRLYAEGAYGVAIVHKGVAAGKGRCGTPRLRWFASYEGLSLGHVGNREVAKGICQLEHEQRFAEKTVEMAIEIRAIPVTG